MFMLLPSSLYCATPRLEAVLEGEPPSSECRPLRPPGVRTRMVVRQLQYLCFSQHDPGCRLRAGATRVGRRRGARRRLLLRAGCAVREIRARSRARRDARARSLAPNDPSPATERASEAPIRTAQSNRRAPRPRALRRVLWRFAPQTPDGFCSFNASPMLPNCKGFLARRLVGGRLARNCPYPGTGRLLKPRLHHPLSYCCPVTILRDILAAFFGRL